MEQQPPQSSTPPPRPVPPPSQGAGGGAATPAPPPATDEPLPNIEITVCPICREPRAEDARFCEECGHDFGADPTPGPPAEEERPMFSGPVLWAIMLFWVALALGGLFFLYNALWSL